MTFTHYVTPKIKLERFDLKVPFPKNGLRFITLIDKNKGEIFKTKLLSFNKIIKFDIDVPLQIGTTYVLKISDENI